MTDGSTALKTVLGTRQTCNQCAIITITLIVEITYNDNETSLCESSTLALQSACTFIISGELRHFNGQGVGDPSEWQKQGLVLGTKRVSRHKSLSCRPLVPAQQPGVLQSTATFP